MEATQRNADLEEARGLSIGHVVNGDAVDDSVALLLECLHCLHEDDALTLCGEHFDDVLAEVLCVLCVVCCVCVCV